MVSALALPKESETIAKIGESDLVASGMVARVPYAFLPKTSVETKVFVLSKFAIGSDKKETV
jgi:putative transposase